MSLENQIGRIQLVKKVIARAREADDHRYSMIDTKAIARLKDRVAAKRMAAQETRQDIFAEFDDADYRSGEPCIVYRLPVLESEEHDEKDPTHEEPVYVSA